MNLLCSSITVDATGMGGRHSYSWDKYGAVNVVYPFLHASGFRQSRGTFSLLQLSGCV